MNDVQKSFSALAGEARRPGSMTPTTSTSASSLWQYINDSMEQYGSLDLTSAATSKAPIVAGVGLVLDTRQQDALARLAGIEKQMSEMHGTADQTCGEVWLSVLAFRWCGACALVAWRNGVVWPRIVHPKITSLLPAPVCVFCRSCKKWVPYRTLHSRS